jgi:uncharacterized protein (DUF1015 family)
MADVRPFCGIRYSPSVVGDLSDVLCPPFDSISISHAETLRGRSVYNTVNLELAPDGTKESLEGSIYTRRGAQIRRWLDEEVLVREPSPAMYVLEEEYVLHGVLRRRRGLMALVRLEELDSGVVVLHENTNPAPKADRLALMKTTRINLSPLLALFHDTDGVMSRLLDRAGTDGHTLDTHLEGVSRYRLHTVTEPRALSEITQAMESRQVFLADGHHRYEAALSYRDHLEDSEGPLSPNASARYIMMNLVPTNDSGLQVLPFHRLASGLSKQAVGSLRGTVDGTFDSSVPGVQMGSAKAIASHITGRLAAQPPSEFIVAALGLEPGKLQFLTLPEGRDPRTGGPPLERSDMWVLHSKAITPALGGEIERKSVSLTNDTVEAVERVQSGKAQVGFFLRGLPMELFYEVVGDGGRLPPKTTCFWPKLPTGLVLSDLQGDL